jgi:ADP-heptose:LPS heptosyltransferase
MKKILVILNAIGMGDALCFTPSLRKLYHAYNQKISIQSKFNFLFKNNPYIAENFSFSDNINLNDYEVFSCFENQWLGKMHNTISHRKIQCTDVRRSCAFDLGFDLIKEEMQLDFFPEKKCVYDIKSLGNYICLHTTSNWKNRTWSDKNWQDLVKYLSELNLNIVVFGKDYEETVFDGSKIFKKCFVPSGDNVIDFTNDNSSINDLWHLINSAKILVTSDTGPLHLAGTTDTWIVQIGSARHPELSAPYRNGNQNYKYFHIGGECELFCINNLKYTVKEWKTINAIHYLPECQEGYSEMKCHPNSMSVFKKIKEIHGIEMYLNNS